MDIFLATPRGCRVGSTQFVGFVRAYRVITTIIVISPLVSLMQDQVNQLEKQGISAVSLSETSVRDDKLISGHYTFVYSSPELLLSNEAVRELIGSKVYKERVVGVVVDEAHCISHW